MITRVEFVLVNGRTVRVPPRLAQELLARGRGTYLTRDMQAPPAVALPEPPPTATDAEDDAPAPAPRKRGRPPKAKVEDVPQDRAD